MHRRLFLKTAALSTLGVAAVAWGQERKKIPVGLQIYTVRELAKKDMAGTLKGVAKIGYVGAEFAGLYDNDPKEVRKMLDDCGLKCCGYYAKLAALQGDEFERTVEAAKILDTEYLTVGSLNFKILGTPEGNKAYAEEFNKIAERAKAVGMRVGYHAHKGDGVLIDGVTAWERFFDATSEDVLMQMDVGNFISGGGDPYRMIEKFKGRSKQVHLKETDRKVIGEGDVDWKRVFDLCESVGGTEWYIVEDGNMPATYERAEQCFRTLKKMGKV